MLATYKTLRERLGLSASDIARASRVSERSAFYWETGRRQPPADVLAWIEGLQDSFQDAIADTLAAVSQVDDFSPRCNQALKPADAQGLAEMVEDMPSIETALPALILLRPRDETLYRPLADLPYRVYCALLGAISEHLQIGGFFVEPVICWDDGPAILAPALAEILTEYAPAYTWELTPAGQIILSKLETALAI